MPTSADLRSPEPATLSRSSPEPLYVQLADVIARQIDSGLLSPGARLGSELELMVQYGVSRVTVRQATALLQRQDKLVARRGKGTFVAGRVLTHDLEVLQGFYDSLRSQGIEPRMELLEFTPDADPSDEDGPGGTDLRVRLKRLYFLDNVPFALVVAYLPNAAGSLKRTIAEQLTVYQILDQELGLRASSADIRIRCLRPPRSVARLLGMRHLESGFVMERRSLSQDNFLCEFMRIYIVPERYEFHLRVSSNVQISHQVRLVTNNSASRSADIQDGGRMS